MSLRLLARPAHRLLALQARPSSSKPPAAAQPDPWPLPFSASHLASSSPTPSTNPDDLELRLDPLDRSHETDLALTKKRLVYQARKRGMLEGDLLLATFARDHLGSMGRAEVKEFDEVRLAPLPFTLGWLAGVVRGLQPGSP